MVINTLWSVDMIQHVKEWYNGEVKIYEFDNDSDDGSLYVMPMIYTEYHWTAKAARNVVTFYIQHWQWIWSTLIAFLALYATVITSR